MCAVRNAMQFSHHHQLATSLSSRSQSLGRCIAGQYRGGVAGPAGPALAGTLSSGELVSFSECRDSVRTRRFGQVSHASSPLPCVYAFLVIVLALLPADQEPGAARRDCIGTHAF